MKKAILILSVLFIMLCFFNAPDSGGELRLRVIANSDSVEDQSEKRRVAECAQTLLCKKDFESLDKAEEWIGNNLIFIKEHCQNSADRHTAKAYLRDEYYESENRTCRSLVIVLGEGKGHNFWGTLFPSLTSRMSLAQGRGKKFFLIENGDGLFEARVLIFDLFSGFFKKI